MTIHVNTNPVAQGYAARDEKIVEYSSPSGGGLISLREVDGRLVVDLYRHDDTVDVRVGAPDGMQGASVTVTPAARGFLARAAAEAREAGADPATQAALDSAARLGIRAKLTADEGLSAARQELIAAERKVDAAVRAKVADRVRQTYPTAHTLVAEGEWNEDGLLHLHVKKVLDAEGTMLDGYDENGVSLSVDFDDLTNEIDALLDEIAERDDGYQGTHEFDVKDPTKDPTTASE